MEIHQHGWKALIITALGTPNDRRVRSRILIKLIPSSMKCSIEDSSWSPVSQGWDWDREELLWVWRKSAVIHVNPKRAQTVFWLFRFVSLHPMIHNILPFPDHPSDYAYFSIYSRWLVLSRVSVFSGESRKVLWWCVECSLSAVFDFACSPFSTQLSHHSFNDDDNDHGVLILSIASPQNRLVALIYYTRSASNHDVIHNREGHKMLDFSEK